MPKAKEPKHPLDKREVLHKEPPDVARIDAVVEQLIAEGRHPETVEYLEVTRNPQLIGRLAEDAVKRGSTFLLQAFERLSDSHADSAQWEELARNALSAERYLDAVRAYTAMGNAERAEEVRQKHCPDYEPFNPRGK